MSNDPDRPWFLALVGTVLHRWVKTRRRKKKKKKTIRMSRANSSVTLGSTTSILLACAAEYKKSRDSEHVISAALTP